MAVDAQGVLVGVWLLVTSRFQPSPLASRLRAAPREAEQSVSVSLPVSSSATASPVQCILVVAGVIGCRDAPTLNLQVEQAEEEEHLLAVTADEVAQDLHDPTVDQTEEEKAPNGYDSG